MYRVLYGADVLYDPRDPDLVLTGMKAELALNETGSFEFSMPLAHPHRDSIALMQKHREIVLEQDGEVLFRGRAVRCEKGFFGDAEYRCEGERAYLNDVALPPYSTTQPGVPSTVDGLFNWYVSQYNAKVPPGQRFLAGVNQGAELDPNNHVLRESSGRSYVWPELKEKLLGKLGGYVRVRHEGGLRYIDYLASGDRASAQRIEFGVNLLDYARLQDATRFCTRVVPVGAEVEDAEGNGTGVKLSISDLPDGPLRQGYEKVGDAVVNIEAERVCGVIEQVVEFEDVTVARNLLDRALRHAVNVVVGDTMELTAVDLHLVDPSVERIRLGDYVRACSKPHGFDEYFMCARLTIYPDDPGANKFVLGSEYDTLTGRQSAKIASLNASIVKQHDAVKQIDQAAKDAAKKAGAAQGSADKAQTDADAAKLAADAAKAEADKAFADATQAAADALAAKRKADEATAKVEVAESEMTVVKQAVAGAEAASSAAQLAAGEASTKAGAAQTAATEAKTSAGTAIKNAAAAIATADAATAQAAGAKADAAQVRSDLAGQIKTVTDTMAADYTKKTDLTLTESRLMSEIERSAAGVTSTVAQQYAKKTDLSTVQADLQTKITQNAEAITSTAASVTAVDAKANNAQSAADAAKTAAAKAQTDATAAAGNAAAAQTAADTAAANLAAAEANLDAVSIRVGATEADVAAAELAVKNAKAAADAAAASATTAKTNAATAQATADAAKTAAGNAQAAADALGTRVAAAETKIVQSADEIALRATKTEVDTAKAAAIGAAAADATAKANAAKSGAVTTAAGDATAKANNALASAKTYTDAQIKVTSDSITSTVSKTYATQSALSAVSASRYLISNYSIAIATFKSWCADGSDAGNWVVTSTSGVRVGDTAFVRCYISDLGAYSYAIVIVHTLVSSTVIRGISRGYIDQAGMDAKAAVAPVEDRVAAAESSIKQQADRITANVGETTALGSRMSTVEQTAGSLTTRVSSAEGSISTLQQTSSGFFASIKAAADTASAAKTAADAAKSTATTASANASTAVSTANAAKSTADTASSNANTAKTNAAAAQTAASSAKSTADAAKADAATAQTAAANAQSTASTARTEAANAAKTASNYMQYTVDGLEVGNRSSGAWSGFRSRMAAGAFQVLDAAGNVLSSFGSDLIELGKRSTSAKISLLANNGSIIGFGTPQLRGLAIASDMLSLCAKAPAESGYAIAPKIVIDSESVAFPNGASFASLCTNQSSAYPVYGGRVLYENASGSAGTVALAESAANFKHMRIYFVDNNGNGYASLDVWEPNGKQPILAMIEGNSNSQTLIRRTKYAINGTTLAPSGINGERGYLCFSTGSIINNDMTANYVRVIAVVGYK